MQHKTNHEQQTRERLEKRLQDAYPDKWPTLTAQEKEYAINKFYELAWPRRVAAKETLAFITNKGLSFGTLLLGTGLAIAGGLTVNILHDFLKDFGYPYFIGVPAAFVTGLWLLERQFERSINEDYTNSGFLDELLEGSEIHEEAQD